MKFSSCPTKPFCPLNVPWRRSRGLISRGYCFSQQRAAAGHKQAKKKGRCGVKRASADFCERLLVAAPSLLMEAQGHEDTVSNLLLALVVLLPAAKLSGGVAERCGQPAVMDRELERSTYSRFVR